MADCNDAGSVSSRVFDYTMLFDDITSGILMKLDSNRRCDVVDELVEELDMSMLMDSRLKVFRYAKKKLLETVTGTGNVDLDPSYTGLEAGESPEDVEKLIGEWGMIARKGKPRVALDMIELLAYVSGQDAYFPHKLLKKRQKKCIAKKARAAVAKAKQPTLPFKPVQNADISSSDDESESDTNESTNKVAAVSTTMETREESQDLFENGTNENDVDMEETLGSDDGDDSAYENVCQVQSNGKNSITETPMSCMTESNPPDTLIHDDMSLGTSSQSNRTSDEPTAHSEMYEIPDDDNEIPCTVDPPETKRSEPVAETVTYANLQRSVPVITEVTPCTPVCRPLSRIESYAKLGITKPVTTVIPPDPRISCAKLGFAKAVITDIPPDTRLRQNSASQTHQRPDKGDSGDPKNSTTMASQTEWDLWGMPISNGRCISAAPTACRCDEVLRKFNEWKGEVERENAARDSQYRAKLNYLREEKLKADAERERMRSHIATLSKSVADNTALTAEMRTRTQRDGIPTRPKPRGPVAFQGFDDIVECPSNQPMDNVKPSNASDYASRQSAPQQQGVTPKPNKDSNRGDARRTTQATAEKTQQQQQQAVGFDRAIVHRESETTARTRDTGIQSSSQKAVSNKSSRDSGPYELNITTRSRPGGAPRQGGIPSTPLPQRAPQPRPRVRDANVNTDTRPQNSTVPVVMKKSSGTQSVTYISWADEPVSDAEMISMANASTPGGRPLNPMATPSARSGNQSRSDILREAIVDTQLKELRNRQENRNVGIYEMTGEKGEKRSFDTSSGSESLSYADTARKDKEEWLTQKNNKNKKKKKLKPDEPVMELLGAKESPNRDLFVIKLDYSRCRRPEQLESMVKNYCKKRGVEVLYAKAFVIQSDHNQANCKISVDESAVETVLADKFWPDPSFARHWYTNNGQQPMQNERSSDDESLSN